MLVLGVSAIFFPIVMNKSVVKVDLPFSLIAALILLVTVVVFNSTTSFIGVGFIFIFSMYTYLRFKFSEKTVVPKEDVSVKDSKIAGLLIFGSLLLYLGGRFTIDSVLFISESLGINEFIISATVLALGTSLPELITAVRASLKQQSDLAVGNVVGSNIFNILWVVGIASLFKDIVFPKIIMTDLFLLAVASFFLFLFLFFGKKKRIDRSEGFILVFMYLLYVLFIIIRG